MTMLLMEGVIRDVFRKTSGYPVPISASITAEMGRVSTRTPNLTIMTDWCQCEMDRGVRLRYCQQWTLQCNQKTVQNIVPLGPCINTHGELLSNHSPSGEHRAVIREVSVRGAVHQYLEVWGYSGLEKSLDLTALNKHGKIYNDEQFACLAWSPHEEKLLYVAEKKKMISSAQTSSISANESEVLVVLEEEDRNVYVEDWGEGLVGKSSPVLCVADLSKGEVTVCAGVSPHVSPGQALWAGDGKGVIFVGWWHEPFRLGLKFCSNRRSALFYIDLKGNCELLSSDSGSVLSPRLSPDHHWLVYLQGQVFGPHHQCLRMMLFDVEKRTNSVLVDVVRRAEKGQFSGIYNSLPPECWSSDSEVIFFSTACDNSKSVFLVERRTGIIKPVYDCNTTSPGFSDQEFGSAKLLTVMKDLMVICCSSPNHPCSLMVGFVSDEHSKQNVELVHLGGADVCEKFDWESMIIKPSPEEENHQYSGLNIGAVLLKPESSLKGVKFPLVVFIHGGPHTHFAAEWNANAAALTKLGFAVLMVNYRGSTGFGQDSIDSLLGNVGSQDVKDVQRAVLHVLQSNQTLDANRVAVMGGSHGGFLACHLIGQYPNFYRACAARNPVINAATLLGTSDITDWRYSSVGLHYSFDQLPSPQALTTMLEKSPIVHAAQVGRIRGSHRTKVWSFTKPSRAGTYLLGCCGLMEMVILYLNLKLSLTVSSMWLCGSNSN
ncbi:S9 family peptidase isoform X2 [Hoplias malabaricus]|uniref:S9 family peptidase isoform X2 n=1 Tax=Hoplias malabaricus TaxID=27720 RepID=UPI00346348E1